MTPQQKLIRMEELAEACHKNAMELCLIAGPAGYEQYLKAAQEIGVRAGNLSAAINKGVDLKSGGRG